MPLLEDLLAQLEPSELQTVHTSLRKADKQWKKLVLLELQTSSESLTRDDLMSRLYKEPNRNAFDNIRNRLIKRFFECVVSEMASQEDNPLVYTLGLMMLCHRMAVTLYFGAKAEEIATRHHMDAQTLRGARTRLRWCQHRQRSTLPRRPSARRPSITCLTDTSIKGYKTMLKFYPDKARNLIRGIIITPFAR
jgi:hypothetical protein